MDVQTLLLVEAGNLIAFLATLKAVQVGNSRRIAQLERKIDNLGVTYIPRTEAELALRGIEFSSKQILSLVQAAIYSGDAHRGIRNIEAVGAGRDFTQICIEGVDGKGGLYRWEVPIPFFYLDSHRAGDGTPAPLVTIGLGCAIDLAEALTLPFQIDGRAATHAEIADDFDRVQAAPFGLVAPAYAKLTRCRLSHDAMEDLVMRRFAVYLCALRRMFPGFDGFPETVKAGALDLIYGLGVAGMSLPHYPAYHAAMMRCDWAAAAAECGSDTNVKAYAARNQARAQLFLQAGTSISASADTGAAQAAEQETARIEAAVLENEAAPGAPPTPEAFERAVFVSGLL